jgi:hypothetical protein
MGEQFFPGWPQTPILPISVTQVARITGLSHKHPVSSDIKILIGKNHYLNFNHKIT